MSMGASRSALLFPGSDCDFATLSRAHDAIEKSATEELHLDVYPVQMEIISSEQMLDAYSYLIVSKLPV